MKITVFSVSAARVAIASLAGFALRTCFRCAGLPFDHAGRWHRSGRKTEANGVPLSMPATQAAHVARACHLTVIVIFFE
jgi:hypothetical protein